MFYLLLLLSCDLKTSSDYKNNKNIIFYNINYCNGILIENKDDFKICYDTTNNIVTYSIHKLSNKILQNKNYNFSYFKQEKYSLKNKDFINSGYDKGHMIAAEDFDYDSIKKKNTYTLYNVNPMSPKFNRSIWKKEENKSRKIITDGFKDSIYIFNMIINIDTLTLNDKLKIPTEYLRCNIFNDSLNNCYFIKTNGQKIFKNNLNILKYISHNKPIDNQRFSNDLF